MEVAVPRLVVGFALVFLLGVLFAVANGFYAEREGSQLPFIVYAIALASVLVGAALVFLLQGRIQRARLERVLRILPSDQQAVVKVLLEHGNELEQNRIVAFTGLKKVRVTRVLQRLEARGVVEKKRAGQTNLVLLRL